MSKRGGTWLPFVFFLGCGREVCICAAAWLRGREVCTRAAWMCVCVCAQNLDDRT